MNEQMNREMGRVEWVRRCRYGILQHLCPCFTLDWINSQICNIFNAYQPWYLY